MCAVKQKAALVETSGDSPLVRLKKQLEQAGNPYVAHVLSTAPGKVRIVAG